MRGKDFLLWIRSVFILNAEKRYYYDLFVRNKKWNGPDPNPDEMLRWQAIERCIKNISEKSQNEIKILDVGSGRGWLTNLLSKYGPTEGLEPVGPVVEHARRLFPNIRFHQVGLFEFAKKRAEFDLIVSSEVIEHVPDREKDSFVSGLRALLKTGGHLIITTPRKEILQTLRQQPGQPIEEWMSENEIQELFTRNSFFVVDRAALQMHYEGELRSVYQVWLFRMDVPNGSADAASLYQRGSDRTGLTDAKI